MAAIGSTNKEISSVIPVQQESKVCEVEAQNSTRTKTSDEVKIELRDKQEVLSPVRCTTNSHWYGW